MPPALFGVLIFKAPSQKYFVDTEVAVVRPDPEVPVLCAQVVDAQPELGGKQ